MSYRWCLCNHTNPLLISLILGVQVCACVAVAVCAFVRADEYVSIRQHSSAYVVRQYAHLCVLMKRGDERAIVQIVVANW